MPGHPVQLPRSSQCHRFALASYQGNVVTSWRPTPESMAVPSMGGPGLFSFHTFMPWLFVRSYVSYCFGPACFVSILLCIVFTFDLFFSCLSSNFVLIASIHRSGCLFLVGDSVVHVAALVSLRCTCGCTCRSLSYMWLLLCLFVVHAAELWYRLLRCF